MTLLPIEVAAFRAMSGVRQRGALLIDRDMVVRWISEGVTALLGHSPADVVGQLAPSFVHPDDLAKVTEILSFEKSEGINVARNENVRFVLDIRVLRSDGQWRLLEAQLSNHLADPSVQMLLLDLQLPNQLRTVNELAVHTALQSDVSQIVQAMVDRLDDGSAGRLAAAVFDEDGECLARSSHAPSLHAPSDAPKHGPNERGTSSSPFVTSWDTPMERAAVGRLGFVRVWTRREKPHPVDVDIADHAAAQLAVVIERHRLYGEMTAAAFRDQLTGIANRRALMDELRREADTTDDVMVAYVDLDGFKAINDELGHAAGDLVLATVANRLLNHVRPQDLVARLGGDEFVAVFRPPLPSGDDIIRRFTNAIAEPIEVFGRQVKVQASVGVSVGPAGHSVLEQADLVMLRQKLSGRTGQPVGAR